MLDVCILGGGPAGLSAALWLHNLGLRSLIVEQLPEAGGLQRLNFLTNDWVLGTEGLTGPEFAARCVAQVRRCGVPISFATQPVAMRGIPNGFHMSLASPQGELEVRTKSLLVATGTRYRGQEVLRDVAGFSSIPNAAVAYGPFAFADLADLVGRRVLIIGGGDNAFENAKRLGDSGARVVLAIRSQPRAQGSLVRAVQGYVTQGTCELVIGASVECLRLTGAEIDVTLRQGATRFGVRCDRIHVLAGYQPNTAFLAPLMISGGHEPPSLDRDGYILVDSNMCSSCPGIYAAGDVCNSRFPSVVTAVAQGAMAAKAIQGWVQA